VVRKIAYGVIAVSVVVFGVSFIEVLASTGPSGGWGLALFLSIIGFVAGWVVVQYSVPGFTRADGPKSFAALDVSGTLANPVKHQVDVPEKRWTRTWMNIYFWTGLGELDLGGLFAVGGAISGGTDAVEGGLGMFAILGGIGVVCLWFSYRTYKKDQLHTIGLDATAKIIGVNQTGMWMNNNPVTVLDCKIDVPGHPEYEARHRETVPQVAIGRLTSGATIPVKVNPKNPSDFVVQWEQL
jgi:hypothetical protein